MSNLRFLITAIGSMSAECAISRLKEDGNYVVGCDIYPREWHYETKLCDAFYRAPFATHEDEYVSFLLDVCKKESLSYIVPLTDLEIDVLNRHRFAFDTEGIVLCMQSSEVLEIARDKYKLYQVFEKDINVPSIKTCLLSKLDPTMTFPCIAKPINGRSSEGLIRNASKEQVLAIDNKDVYILQETIAGDVCTVDYCRSSATKRSAVYPRRELLRTKNGAGLTVQMFADQKLFDLTSYIGDKLNINGCVNMEYIQNNGDYYLIDINPRFSAGVAFTVLSGYNMVNNHIKCFVKKDIDLQQPIEEQIMIKKYQEVVF